jgi:hypothetical protein
MNKPPLDNLRARISYIFSKWEGASRLVNPWEVAHDITEVTEAWKAEQNGEPIGCKANEGSPIKVVKP